MSLTLNQSSTVAWAFGQLRIRQPGFWRNLTSDFPTLRSPDGFAAPPAVVVRMLWGMAMAGHRNVAVLQNAAAWMNNGVQLQLCRSEYIAPIIRSFAMLQFSPGATLYLLVCGMKQDHQGLHQAHVPCVARYRSGARMQEHKFYAQPLSSCANKLWHAGSRALMLLHVSLP